MSPDEMSPELLVQTWVLSFALITARVGGLVMAAPLFGGRTTPRQVKIGLTAALAAMWFGSFGVEPTESIVRLAEHPHWLALGVATLREAIFGATLGFSFGLLLMPLTIAGAYIGQEMGLSMASMADPSHDGSSGVVSQLFDALGVLLLFGLDMHHVVLMTAHRAFERWPCGSPFSLARPAALAAAGLADAQEVGLLIAAPVGVCLFIMLIVMFLMAKASPQLNLFTFGMPLRLGAGLVSLLLFLPDICLLMKRLFVHGGELIANM